MLRFTKYICSVALFWLIITPAAMAVGGDTANSAVMALGKKNGSGASVWTVNTKTGKMKYVRSIKQPKNKKPVLVHLGDVDADNVLDVIVHPDKYSKTYTLKIEPYDSNSTSYTLEKENKYWQYSRGIELFDYNKQGRDELFVTYRGLDFLGIEAFRLKNNTDTDNHFKQAVPRRFLIGDVQYFSRADIFNATSISTGALDDSGASYLALATDEYRLLLYRVDTAGTLSLVAGKKYKKWPGNFSVSIDSSTHMLYTTHENNKQIKAYSLQNGNLELKPKKIINLPYKPAAIGTADGLLAVVNKKGKKIRLYRDGKLIQTKRVKNRMSSLAFKAQ